MVKDPQVVRHKLPGCGVVHASRPGVVFTVAYPHGLLDTVLALQPAGKSSVPEGKVTTTERSISYCVSPLDKVSRNNTRNGTRNGTEASLTVESAKPAPSTPIHPLSYLYIEPGNLPMAHFSVPVVQRSGTGSVLPQTVTAASLVEVRYHASRDLKS